MKTTYRKTIREKETKQKTSRQDLLQLKIQGNHSKTGKRYEMQRSQGPHPWVDNPQMGGRNNFQLQSCFPRSKGPEPHTDSPAQRPALGRRVPRHLSVKASRTDCRTFTTVNWLCPSTNINKNFLKKKEVSEKPFKELKPM